MGSLCWTKAQKIPGNSLQKSVAIHHGTIHIGNGEKIENGCVVFDQGKITYVGNEMRSADTIILAKNQHIYPGLIALNSKLGLTEIDAVRSTRDFHEVGHHNPHIRALIAYNTDSKIIPTVRSNGIQLVEIVPNGGQISGQSAVVQLDAWNWEDANYQNPAGIHLHWPNPMKYHQGQLKPNENYEKQVEKIHRYLEEVQAYRNQKAPYTSNLRLEAMSQVLQHGLPLMVHANSQEAILDIIQFGEKYHLSIVLYGGAEAWKIAAILAKAQIPVVLDEIHRLPMTTDTDIQQPFTTPALLSNAGVEVSLSMYGSWDQRNLAFQGGQAVAYGLSEEKAIQAITLNPAKILRIDDRTGSIAIGKEANLIISTGNILDPMTHDVIYSFIQGRKIDLLDKQKILYQKFKTKYQIKD